MCTSAVVGRQRRSSLRRRYRAGSATRLIGLASAPSRRLCCSSRRATTTPHTPSPRARAHLYSLVPCIHHNNNSHNNSSNNISTMTTARVHQQQQPATTPTTRRRCSGITIRTTSDALCPTASPRQTSRRDAASSLCSGTYRCDHSKVSLRALHVLELTGVVTPVRVWQ